MVRVLKDYDEILTENGPLRLIKGASHYIRRWVCVWLLIRIVFVTSLLVPVGRMWRS